MDHAEIPSRYLAERFLCKMSALLDELSDDTDATRPPQISVTSGLLSLMFDLPELNPSLTLTPGSSDFGHQYWAFAVALFPDVAGKPSATDAHTAFQIARVFTESGNQSGHYGDILLIAAALAAHRQTLTFRKEAQNEQEGGQVQ